MEKKNVLVLCARNKKRSRTAEFIFKNRNDFSIKTAGFSSKSENKLKEKTLLWADLIFVM